MNISKEYLKENGAIIGEYIKDLIKQNQYTNKQIADILGVNENIVSRKNKNKNGAYYNMDDLNKLSKLFNCSIAKLTFQEFENIDENPIFYQKDYLYKINYLHSIGLHFQPAFFWVGNEEQFKNAKKILIPFLSPTAKKQYNSYKNETEQFNLSDENKYNMFYLLLTDNPIKEYNNLNLEDIKTTNLKNKYFTTSLNYKSDITDKNYKNMGYIEIRFMMFEENNTKSEFKTISIDDLLNIFEFIEKITKTSVKALFENSINDYKNDFNY